MNDQQYNELLGAILDLRGATEMQFVQIDKRFDGIDGRLGGIDGRLDGIDGRLDRIDGRLDRIDRRLDAMDGRFEEQGGELVHLRRDMNLGFREIQTSIAALGARLDHAGLS